MHAFNKLQRDEAQRQAVYWVVGLVVFGGSALALAWVYLFLRRERERELAQLEAEKAREHAEVLMLAAKVEAQEAERAAEETERKLLQQTVDAARAEARAADAERTNLEMRSQLYASIGIMAGSYAHNIKNLLVRPNDLLNRCLETDHLLPQQTTMLNEVKSTLGTVTERLQMILRTVRRDPNKADMTRLDLNDLIRETGQMWAAIGNEKWKLKVDARSAAEPLYVRGDLSHLQQAIENLVFNARDATFEMRNHVREAARAEPDPAARRQAIIDAAAWRGEVVVTGYRDGEQAVLEVTDNGIGMTPDVREQCLQTHFSTKRENALYEGYNAGMGLGLSFVAVVLEHHGAKLEIESEPLKGATFRVRFPIAVG
jgi:signal transduction histidine kinase